MVAWPEAVCNPGHTLQLFYGYFSSFSFCNRTRSSPVAEASDDESFFASMDAAATNAPYSPSTVWQWLGMRDIIDPA